MQLRKRRSAWGNSGIILVFCLGFFWVAASGLSTAEAARALPVSPENERWLRRRPEVGKVEIQGNFYLSDGMIRRYLELTPSSFWAKLGLRRRKVVRNGAWQRDSAAVLALYSHHGFLNAAVNVGISREENNRAKITVAIREGPQTFWGEIRLTDEQVKLAGYAAGWLNKLQRGEPANPHQLSKTLNACQLGYADNGYPYARFTARWDLDSTRWDTAHVAVTIKPGPQVRFGKVEVIGNSYTKTNIIRRELSFRPGDLYSRKQIIQSQNNIYRTGLFTYSRLQLKPDSSRSPEPRLAADFLARVVERKPSYVELATGAGQDLQQDLTWEYSLEWGTRNWFGTGRRWALQAKSERIVVTDWQVLYNRFAARYTEPWIFGMRLPTTVQFAYEPGVRSVVQPYRVEKYEGELNFLQRFGRTRKTWLSFVYEKVNIDGFDSDEAREIFKEEQGITVTRKIVFALERDSRPNIFVPTSGSLTRLDLEWAGEPLGGDFDWYRVGGSWARFQTISASVLASRIKIGWIQSHTGGSIPSIHRYYLGGANSIRGYQENRVGPMAEGIPEGGAVIGVANLELRTPVIWKIWFTVFGDAGNNWRRFQDISTETILVSLGVGAQYISPVGPLRVDFAQRVLYPGHPPSSRVHLAILFAF